MTGTTRFWILFTLLLVAALGWLWTRIEWSEEEIDLGYSAEARRNDFLAAERFLVRHGIETEPVTGMALLDDLPPIDDAILMSAAREALSERRWEAMIAWVERGGMLMVIAHSPFDHERGASRDPLLDGLGIFLLEPGDPDAESDGDASGADVDADVDAADEGAGGAGGDSADEEMASGSSPSTEGEAQADDLPETLGEALDRTMEREACRDAERFTDRVSLGDPGARPAHLEFYDENELAVHDEQRGEAYFSPRNRVLALPVGAGRVVAMTSIRPFRNDRIHCHDHAWLLWNTFSSRPKVWMLHDPDVPSLTDLALAHFPISSACGLGLVVLACAVYSIRFERPAPTAAAPRREHLEHVEASVAFRYGKGGFGSLIRRLRADLSTGAPHDREKWAARARVPRVAVSAALSEDIPRGRRAILERTTWMLRLRRTR